MLITIIDVGTMQQLTSAAGKSYKAMEVTFKNEQGQVSSKKIMEFDKVLSKIFPTFVKGDVVDVLSVKEGDYWQWKGATLAGQGGAGTSGPASNTAAPSNSVAAKSSSNYETSEERAKKQVYIVRQSSISAAINLLGTGAKAPANLTLVLDTAKGFEDYVFGLGDVHKPAMEFKDDFPDDIPY